MAAIDYYQYDNNLATVCALFCEKNGSDIDWLDFDCWIQKLTNILKGCLYHQHGLAACISHLEPRC